MGLFFMDVRFFVYLLTFANGKVYVGMSRTDKQGGTQKRYREHAVAARGGKTNPVYRAWRKHGEPEQTIISWHVTREECAQAEIDAIKAHDSLEGANGYNLMAGGEGLNAPPGSAMHELMRERVWNNPELRQRTSARLKGKPVSDECRAAHAEYINTPEAKARIAEVAKRPETRAANSAAMKRRLEDPEYRRTLSENQKGKPKNTSPEGRARQEAGRRAYFASERGKANSRRGAMMMRAKPENEAKWRAAHKMFLHSPENVEHCRAIAARNRKPIRVVATGQIYESRDALAAELGVQAPVINYWIKKGRYEYV